MAHRTPRDRFKYSPVTDRSRIQLPNNSRLVVLTVVNVEHWNIERPMPRSVLPPPHGVTVVPDIPNWSWHEYGLRIGFWRIKQLLDQHKIRATLALNASVCAEYPQIIAGAQASGWEFMGHGFTQIAAQSIENEIGMINETLSTIQSITGRAPRGWLGPGLQETWETPDLLAQCGVEYVCDFVADDQPFELSTFSSPLLALPYTLEINDSPLFMVQYHQAEEFFNRARDQFDRLYQEGAESARIMTIALHPHLMGVPHRIKYLEMVYEYINSHDNVLHWTGSEILDWYRSLSHRK